jgi:hypothetical protein
MSINLGSHNGTVPEKILYILDIHSFFKEQRGEGMPEYMRCDMLFQISQLNILWLKPIAFNNIFAR